MDPIETEAPIYFRSKAAAAGWLERNACTEEIYPGACYVGEGRYNGFLSWDIYDLDDLNAFFAENDDD